MEMLCLMHEAEPYGSLLIKGQPIGTKLLASLCGIDAKKCAILLQELNFFGVLEREQNGTIYSRRMRRDYAKALKDKENGKGGGNPALKQGVNPQDKAQIPEARYQKPEDRKDKKDLEGVRAKRASRLPDDWVPSEADKLFALGEGMSIEGIRLEATKFLNYWTAKGGQGATKTNWERTWQNWVLNSNGTSNGNRTANTRPTGHDAILAVATRAARKIAGECDMAGSADEVKFPFGDVPFGDGPKGYYRTFGHVAADGDGRKPSTGAVLEGKVIALDEAAAGLSERWRRDGTGG
jgi:hypothetical protein